MNTSRLSQGQMITAAGGALLIISLFLHWGGGQSAFDSFSIVDIIMLLVGVAALAWALAPAAGAGATMPPNAPLILAGLGMAVLGFAFGLELEISGDIGVWLAVLGSLAIVYGAYEATRAPLPAASPRTPVAGRDAPEGI